MDEETSADDIGRIEERIEALAEELARCRKISLAAMIGGVVLLGSNATTWTQTENAIRASEALRADTIGRMQLRTVDEGVRRLH